MLKLGYIGSITLFVDEGAFNQIPQNVIIVFSSNEILMNAAHAMTLAVVMAEAVTRSREDFFIMSNSAKWKANLPLWKPKQ